MFMGHIRVFSAIIFLVFGVASAAQICERRNFIQDLTGVTEAQLAQNIGAYFTSVDSYEMAMARKTYTLHNLATRQKWSAGFFREFSLGELDPLLEAIHERPGNGKFSLVMGHQTSQLTPAQRAQVSIQDLQADPHNADAVFQVASNFNALEGTSPLVQPSLSEYVDDLTQGPAASIAAAPGLILRRYVLSMREEINFLSNVTDQYGEHIPVTNGYPRFDYFSRLDPHAAAERLGNFSGFDVKNARVGYHGDQSVAFGSWPDSGHHTKLANDQQRINQVFTAALDLGTASGSGLALAVLTPAARNSIEMIAKKLLRVAYEGTIRAAIVNGKNKVFLTLVGGGVFKNKLDWIADAITATQADVVAFGLDVTVVVYDATKHEDQEDSAAFKTKIENLVAKTHGTSTMLHPATPIVQVVHELVPDVVP